MCKVGAKVSEVVRVPIRTRIAVGKKTMAWQLSGKENSAHRNPAQLLHRYDRRYPSHGARQENGREDEHAVSREV
jgi:hypothetical protein